MAATVKKFRPELITRTKATIFRLVSEMELLNQQPSVPNTQTISIIYNSPSDASSNVSDIDAFTQAFQDVDNFWFFMYYNVIK